MSENPLAQFQHYILAGIAGVFGVYGGVKVHGAKIDSLKEDVKEVKEAVIRLEGKVDRHFENR